MKPHTRCYGLATFLSLFVGLLVTAKPSLCWHDETHRGINEAGAFLRAGDGFSLDDYLRAQLGLKEGLQTRLKGRAIVRIVGDGGPSEDIIPRWINHFHDPLQLWNSAGLWLPGSSSSVIWAQMGQGAQNGLPTPFTGAYSWHDARAYYRQALTEATTATREEALSKTFRALGQVMHLVADVAVPNHSRNDIKHGPYATFGVINIETWVEERYDTYVRLPIKPFLQGDLQRLLCLGGAPCAPNPLAPVPISRLFDTETYRTVRDPERTTDPVTGLGEYSNANFLTERSLFTTYEYPSLASTEDAGDPGYLKKVGQGEVVGHIARSESILGETRYTLDDACYADYATLLIPRAIQYAAAVPYYFFRGNLAVDAAEEVDASGVTQVSVYVRTLSPDDLGKGSFTLYYDDMDGTRKQVGTPIDVSGLTRADPPLSFTFTPPSSRVNDTYTLVFQGILGLEEDAVIGAVFIPSAYTFATVDAPYDYHTTLIRITNTGHILGGTYTYDLATGSFTPIPLNQEASFYGMNDQGDLAGYAVTRYAPPDRTVTYHGYLITAAGETLFDVPGMTSTIALDINNAGDTVGYCWVSLDPLQPFYENAFLKKAGQTAVPFMVPGSTYTYAYGINDAGQIVGEYGDTTGNYGFLLTAGAYTTITPPGTLHTQPLDINTHGEIVGTYADTSGQHGFVLSNGHYTRIRYPGAAHTWALGINDAGAITGYYTDAARRQHGFVGVPKKKAVP
jgi:hypothetical protein